MRTLGPLEGDAKDDGEDEPFEVLGDKALLESRHTLHHKSGQAQVGVVVGGYFRKMRRERKREGKRERGKKRAREKEKERKRG